MNDLQGRGLIRSGRGQVRILNREGLKRAANGFYGIAEAEYERMLHGGAEVKPLRLVGGQDLTLVIDDQSRVPWMTSAGLRFALAVLLFSVLLLGGRCCDLVRGIF